MLDGIGYSGSDEGTVYSFATETGVDRWQTSLGGTVRNVAIANGVIYALSDGPNAVYALDASNGKQLWSFPVDGGIVQTAVRPTCVVVPEACGGQAPSCAACIMSAYGCSPPGILRIERRNKRRENGRSPSLT